MEAAIWTLGMIVFLALSYLTILFISWISDVLHGEDDL